MKKNNKNTINEELVRIHEIMNYNSKFGIISDYVERKIISESIPGLKKILAQVSQVPGMGTVVSKLQSAYPKVRELFGGDASKLSKAYNNLTDTNITNKSDDAIVLYVFILKNSDELMGEFVDSVYSIVPQKLRKGFYRDPKKYIDSAGFDENTKKILKELDVNKIRAPYIKNKENLRQSQSQKVAKIKKGTSLVVSTFIDVGVWLPARIISVIKVAKFVPLIVSYVIITWILKELYKKIDGTIITRVFKKTIEVSKTGTQQGVEDIAQSISKSQNKITDYFNKPIFSKILPQLASTDDVGVVKQAARGVYKFIFSRKNTGILYGALLVELLLFGSEGMSKKLFGWWQNLKKSGDRELIILALKGEMSKGFTIDEMGSRYGVQINISDLDSVCDNLKESFNGIISFTVPSLLQKFESINNFNKVSLSTLGLDEYKKNLNELATNIENFVKSNGNSLMVLSFLSQKYKEKYGDTLYDDIVKLLPTTLDFEGFFEKIMIELKEESLNNITDKLQELPLNIISSTTDKVIDDAYNFILGESDVDELKAKYGDYMKLGSEENKQRINNILGNLGVEVTELGPESATIRLTGQLAMLQDIEGSITRKGNLYLLNDKLHSSNVSGSEKINLKISTDTKYEYDGFKKEFDNVKKNPKDYCDEINTTKLLSTTGGITNKISCENIDSNNEFFITILTLMSSGIKVYLKE